jgi:HAD superfamily hydrolase (TIGR01509 family)
MLYFKYKAAFSRKYGGHNLMVIKNRSLLFSTAFVGLIALILIPTFIFTHNAQEQNPLNYHAMQAEQNQQAEIAVVFDMNGVLVHTSKATKVLGYNKFLAYSMFHNPFNSKKAIKQKLMKFLESIEKRDVNDIPAYDEDQEMPQIMTNWLKGTHSPSQILQKIQQEAKLQPKSLEQSIINSIARMMFTPELLIKTQEWVPGAVDFVKELKAQGCKVYVLTNWDAESFAIMKTKHSEIFDLFDGIIVSGEVGMVKPDPAIYNHVLKTYDIDCKYTVFIDNEAMNVAAAQKLGIHGIVCKQKKGWFSSTPNIDQVRKDFYTLKRTILSAQENYRALPIAG